MYFFFSSRRRHTRYWRDWSSDVCSSDLTPASTGVPAVCAHLKPVALVADDPSRVTASPPTAAVAPATTAVCWTAAPARSEERRVGKERRVRWRASHHTKSNETTHHTSLT